MKKRLSLMAATGFYLGFIPGAPGTYASVATTLAYYLVLRASNRIIPELHLSVVCLVSAVGVFASTEVGRMKGLKDPQIVVIDEIAGQLVSFLFLPPSLRTLAIGTLLFRAFDIWKPYPIRRLERLPEGVGIMADDILAGIYANLTLRLIIRLLP